MDPIVTRVSGRPLAAGAPRGASGTGPRRRGWRSNRDWRCECSGVRNCPEWECVGVRPVRVGRLARSFAGDPRHNSGSDPLQCPRLVAQPGTRRTRLSPPMQRRAKPRPSGCRYPSGTAMPTWPPEKESSLISMLDEDCWLRKIPSISDVPLSIFFRSRSRQPHPADGDAARHHEGCGSHGSGSVRDRSLQRQRRG